MFLHTPIATGVLAILLIAVYGDSVTRGRKSVAAHAYDTAIAAGVEARLADGSGADSISTRSRCVPGMAQGSTLGRGATPC